MTTAALVAHLWRFAHTGEFAVWAFIAACILSPLLYNRRSR